MKAGFQSGFSWVIAVFLGFYGGLRVVFEALQEQHKGYFDFEV